MSKDTMLEIQLQNINLSPFTGSIFSKVNLSFLTFRSQFMSSSFLIIFVLYALAVLAFLLISSSTFLFFALKLISALSFALYSFASFCGDSVAHTV